MQGTDKGAALYLLVFVLFVLLIDLGRLLQLLHIPITDSSMNSRVTAAAAAAAGKERASDMLTYP